MSEAVPYSPPPGRGEHQSEERKEWLRQVWGWWRAGLNTAEMARRAHVREGIVERDLNKLLDGQHSRQKAMGVA